MRTSRNDLHKPGWSRLLHTGLYGEPTVHRLQACTTVTAPNTTWHNVSIGCVQQQQHKRESGAVPLRHRRWKLPAPIILGTTIITCGPPPTEASLCSSGLDSLHLFSKVLNAPEHWFPSIFLATNPFFRVSVALRFGKPRGWFEACALSAQTSCHPSKTENPEKQSAKSLPSFWGL